MPFSVSGREDLPLRVILGREINTTNKEQEEISIRILQRRSTTQQDSLSLPGLLELRQHRDGLKSEKGKLPLPQTPNQQVRYGEGGASSKGASGQCPQAPPRPPKTPHTGLCLLLTGCLLFSPCVQASSYRLVPKNDKPSSPVPQRSLPYCHLQRPCLHRRLHM